MIPLSVLDLVPVPAGGSAGDALRNSQDLARQVERQGYHRIWVAEHHNFPSIASAATSLVIGHLAGATATIRVGAGGIMLPNHSPLVIAEQFGTLAELYPGRIDLGLGRAPGTDPVTVRAMRRDPMAAERFPQDVQELQALLGPVHPNQPVQAVPGGGTEVPLWILGSSLFGASLAAALGLPYAFASHFAPDALIPALATYRNDFQPSAQQPRPYLMMGINVMAADTDAEARRQFTTMQQAFTNIQRGTRGAYPAPIDDIDQYWSAQERVRVNHMLRYSLVGGPDTVRKGLTELVNETGVDELIVVTVAYEHATRVRSYEILADLARDLDPRA